METPSDLDNPAVTANARTRLATVTMILALCALGASALLFALPVSSPGVQSCGSPAWFLLKAESNTPLVDTDGKAINGWNQSELRKAYENRCSVLVAHRAVPAALLLAGFWVLVVVGWILGFSGRRSLARHQLDGV